MDKQKDKEELFTALRTAFDKEFGAQSVEMWSAHPDNDAPRGGTPVQFSTVSFL